MPTSATLTRIAKLNDQFRKEGPAGSVPGLRVATAGISALPLPAQLVIWRTVTDFDAFTADNDPYGEHDFGAFELARIGKIFWKIDCYADRSMTWGSEHPEDPAQSFRVLTVMLAEEY